jgi:hypothetical protein
MLNIRGKHVVIHGSLVRIARLDADKYEFLTDPETMLAALRNSRERVDLFTFLQHLPDGLKESAKCDPVYPYAMEWDNLAVLPVSTFDRWWTRQVQSEVRNRARQAGKKGVVVREVPFNSALVHGIWAIYNECPLRQGRPFLHYGEDLETVHKEEATYLDQSVFIGAYFEDRLVGFIKLVTDSTKRHANLMNILSLVRHRDKAPTNALIAQAVRSCAERRIPYLLYQNFTYGKKPPDGLTRFKKINGFQRLELPRYYVPLTGLGSAALRLGLHHRMTDRLPKPIYAKLQQWRDAWYTRKFEAHAEAS